MVSLAADSCELSAVSSGAARSGRSSVAGGAENDFYKVRTMPTDRMAKGKTSFVFMGRASYLVINGELLSFISARSWPCLLQPGQLELGQLREVPCECPPHVSRADDCDFHCFLGAQPPRAAMTFEAP